MINYAELKAANRPIESGIQEAACKILVSQRMKGSGISHSFRFRYSHSILKA